MPGGLAAGLSGPGSGLGGTLQQVDGAQGLGWDLLLLSGDILGCWREESGWSREWAGLEGWPGDHDRTLTGAVVQGRPN